MSSYHKAQDIFKLKRLGIVEKGLWIILQSLHIFSLTPVSKFLSHSSVKTFLSVQDNGRSSQQ